MAERWAAAHGIKNEVYPALWSTNGKAAGPMRNQYMLDRSYPDLLMAFPGGRGTKDMVSRIKGRCNIMRVEEDSDD